MNDKRMSTEPRPIPTTNEIVRFIHCGRCVEEWKLTDTGMSPREYASLEVGGTALGLQVWCKRHEANVLHIDFQGHRHPANGSIAETR